MKYQLSLAIALFFGLPLLLHSQETSKSIVHQPLGITQYTSGTFAEPRSNHLHSGTDIRTEGREGLPVYAVNDGYLSRIRVSSTGFGYALYINHPDGTTSVYAHLQRYNDTLAAWTEAQQYKLRKFEVDLFPKAGLLKVTAGEEIARSGNTGSSGGPHLHFELRQTKTEEIMNPQEHGLLIADAREPELRAVWVYPLTPNSFINGRQNPVRVPMKLVGQGSYLLASPMPTVWGLVGLGLEAVDRDDLGSNVNGLLSWSLFEGPDRIFHVHNNLFSFASTRYVNALIDYKERLYKKRNVYLLYRLPGNQFPYLNPKQGALPELFSDSTLSLGILATDAGGNTSAVEFELNYRAPQQAQREATPLGTLVFPEKASQLHVGAIQVDIPAGALYAPAYLNIGLGPMNPLGLPEFTLGPEEVPLHTHATVRIRPTFNHAWKEKTLAVVQKNGKKNYIPVDWIGADAVFKTRDLGKVTWTIDTLPPALRTLHAPGSQAPEMARFKVTDDLSGLEAYTATLNGKWILMTLDAKTGRMTIPNLRSKISGPSRLEIVLTDQVGNSTNAVFEYR